MARAPAYALSLGLHLAGGAVLLALDLQPPKPPIVVTVQTVERKPPPPPPEAPKPEPPPPEPEAPPRPAPAPKLAPAPKPAAAPTAAPAPDFGLAMGSMGSGPGGLAVPVGDPHGAPTKAPVAKTLAAPAAGDDGGCAATDTKAKVTALTRPAYTDDARAAGIQGKVRVELTVDEAGHVTAAHVVEGLGHGLDEAAIAAMQASTFQAATRCGKPVASTFTVGVSFKL